MEIVFAIVILLAGIVLGYFYYRWGVKRDEERLSAFYAEKGEDKRFRVKIRPVWCADPEDIDTIITFDLMAPDEADAEEYAYSFLFPTYKSVSHTYETLEVFEVTEEG